jgi:asparagine synthase (glutamine-hydrolysing)
MTVGGNRVVLSGIGGDEVLGGVPTPVPELEDLLATSKFTALASQLKSWALHKRKPWFYLLLEAARGFFPPALVGIPEHNRPAKWLCSGFLERYQSALSGYQTRLKLFGPLPSFQENISTLAVLRRQLACLSQSSELLVEKRYPYLDRDLLEFLYAVPREQLVRPGQRRSLMRRALAGIVPRELLDRKQKAYVARSSIAAISTAWNGLVRASQHMLASYRGIVDADLFTEAVAMAQHGQNISLVTLIRALALEFWLRIIAERKLLTSV